MRAPWMDDAACRGQDLTLFFPDGLTPTEKSLQEFHAVDICRTCPVVLECREHALTFPENYGVWGGMTEDQLRAERQRRRRAAREQATAA